MQASSSAGTEARARRIDTHSHYISKLTLEEIRESGHLAGVTYQERADVGTFVETPERPYGPIRAGFHSVGERLDYLDKNGLDMQLLLPPPFVFYYWSSSAAAVSLMELQNDETARTAANSRGRLIGFGTVMLQDVAASIREVERIKKLGMLGVEIGSNVNGEGLDCRKLDDFYAALQDNDMSLFIHPHNVAGQERMGDYHLRNLIGFPVDTSLAAAQLIFSGVLDRFPNLRICLGQAGGFLPYIIGRLDAGFRARPECSRNISQPPTTYLRRFFYDTIIHSANSSAFLIKTVGADRVMLGTDFPFDMNATSPIADLEQQSLSEADQNAIYSETARRFLGLSQDTPAMVASA
jgi:aminocarboxymuconate-semialdehyde decarboxylase